MSDSGTIRTGMVAIVGRPNAGKSTFLNAVLGEKIAITSPKPQTTRDRILGVLHVPSAQIVFVDTPGVHRDQKSKLNAVMVSQALGVLLEVDLVLLVVDAARQCKSNPGEIHPEDLALARAVRRSEKPVILLLNKTDLVDKPLLLPAIAAWAEALPLLHCFPVSALKRQGLGPLVDALVEALPEGEPAFPEDMITDRPQRFLAAELIREQLFRQLGQELPYGVAVEIEGWDEDERLVRMQAAIHVDKAAHKKIVVGKGGARIKAVGTAARHELEQHLERKVFLELFVHVEEGWTDRDRALARFGYLADDRGSGELLAPDPEE